MHWDIGTWRSFKPGGWRVLCSVFEIMLGCLFVWYLDLRPWFTEVMSERPVTTLFLDKPPGGSLPVTFSGGDRGLLMQGQVDAVGIKR